MSQGVSLLARDVSGQRSARIRSCPGDCTVTELVIGLLETMRLPPLDTGGRPLSYQARLEREGRALLGSEIVGEAMQENDEIVLQPNVDAGGR